MTKKLIMSLLNRYPAIDGWLENGNTIVVFENGIKLKIFGGINTNGKSKY